MEADALLNKYSKMTAKLTHTEGKPDDLAAQLVTVHNTVSADAAGSLYKIWEDTDMRSKAIVGAVNLESGGGSSVSSFEEAISKAIEEDPKLTYGDAYTKVKRSNPVLFSEHNARFTQSAGADLVGADIPGLN